MTMRGFARGFDRAVGCIAHDLERLTSMDQLAAYTARLREALAEWAHADAAREEHGDS